jgi:hypothetical protein
MGLAFDWRIGVGDPAAIHSEVWVVKAKKSDVYITTRSMGKELKVSCHDRDYRQVGLTSYLPDGVKKSRLDTWEPYLLEPGCKLEYLIHIPTSQLRRFSTRDAEKVDWVPAAPPGHAVEFALLCFEPELQPKFQNTGEAMLIKNDGILPDGRKFWLVARIVPERHFTNDPALKEDIQAKWMPSEFRPSGWLMIGFVDGGVRGSVERASDWVQPNVTAEPGL